VADTLFRVHFADDTKLDVTAPTPEAAREKAEERSDAKITKIKRVKG
jgi:hypothetical protein